MFNPDFARTAVGLSVVSLVVLASACVLPDDVARLRKDVADVHQELAGIRKSQEETQARLGEVEGRLGSPDRQGVDRAEFADLKVRVEEIAREVVAQREKLDEVNRRADRLSQAVEETRELSRSMASRLPAQGALPSGEGTREGATPPVPGSTPAPSAQALPDAEALYNQAYADFSKGNYSLAVSGFQEYAARFPESDLADNALYWVGECLFSQGDFDGAVGAFDRMLEKYPKSDRAAAANLKKGLAFFELNQVGRAIVQLRYVVSTYPATDEARIARDKLASLGAPVR